MNQASYITHVELENPNLIPEIKVYLYTSTKYLSGTGKTNFEIDLNSNYATWYNTNPITLWETTADRFDITPFSVSVGTINYRSQDEFLSPDTLTSSTSLVLLKKIEDFYTLNDQQKGFHFDTIQPQDESFDYNNANGNSAFSRINAFNVAGYRQDGQYADIEISLTIKDQSGSSLGTSTLFRGLVNSISSSRNEVTLEILDGLIEARRKGNRVGETIRSEISSFKERFYGADTDFQYDQEEAFDMSAVVNNHSYNLKHFPVVPPLRDTQDKVVKLKIQRDNPVSFSKQDKVSTQRHEVYDSGKFDPSEIYTGYNFQDGEQVERINKSKSLSWKKFEVDWQSGILKFELPPIIDAEGSLFIEEYKTVYKHKHPSFLAEELFKELGYKNVDFDRENLSPYYPSEGEPFLYEWKIPSKRGIVNRNRDGRNFGATAIHFCPHDNLYYYFSKGGIYKTDFETLNEKVCSTNIRERYYDVSDSKWKLVDDSTKGNDINELDVNQITVVKPHGKNTALRVIATVNRKIEFEEDNPYDIPYPRTRVSLGSEGDAGKAVKSGDLIFPDRDSKFNWNYDDNNSYDDVVAKNYFIGYDEEDLGKSQVNQNLSWSSSPKSTHNWNTSSFNEWRKDTICTLYYFDIENYANDFYYFFNGSIYKRTNAGVVTKAFDITHGADKVTFLSSHTYTDDNEQSQTENNVIRIDYTYIGSTPYKVRVHYSSSGTRLGATVFKSPTSGSIIFPQNSDPTKLHDLDFDNATESDPGYSMIPVDPLYETATPSNYGENSATASSVSTNPQYYLATSTSGSQDKNYIGWRTRQYANEDLFYVNKHTLLYGDKLNNNFVIIDDTGDSNKQILVALEIGYDELAVNPVEMTGESMSSVNPKIRIPDTWDGFGDNPSIPSAWRRFYQKAIYLCYYDISGTTLTETNKQRIGVSNQNMLSTHNNGNRGYVGFALQRFNHQAKLKDSFIGADILYEKENGRHFIYVLLNDTILRFRWESDHSKLNISNDTANMTQTEVQGGGIANTYDASKQTEVGNALSIRLDETSVTPFNANPEAQLRFQSWSTENLFHRITNKNKYFSKYTSQAMNESISDDSDSKTEDRSANFIKSPYLTKYISEERLKYRNDGVGNNIFYGKIQSMFDKSCWIDSYRFKIFWNDSGTTLKNNITNVQTTFAVNSRYLIKKGNTIRIGNETMKVTQSAVKISGEWIITVDSRTTNNSTHSANANIEKARTDHFNESKLDVKVYDNLSSPRVDRMGFDEARQRTFLKDPMRSPLEYNFEKDPTGYHLGARSYQYIAPGHMEDHIYKVSQVYGLSKMKGKNVFSIYAVNREYFSKKTPRRSRKDLEGKTQRYRNSGDTLFEHNMEGMMAYQYTIDFDEKTNMDDKIPNLRLSSEIYPTAIHQQYYDIINELTSELQIAREETGGNITKEDDTNLIKKLIPPGTGTEGLDEKLMKVLTPSNRGMQNWEGDLWMGITHAQKGILLYDDNVLTGHHLNRIFTPYKSKYFAYSVWLDNNKKTSTNPDESGRGNQRFFEDKDFDRRQIGVARSIATTGIEGNLICSYDTFLDRHNFWSFLNSRRREFLSRNILPSLLPKTSMNIGSEIVHLIGNFGEYLSSENLVGLADVWTPSHPDLKDKMYNTLQWNEQDTHGTVSITTANFDYPRNRGGRSRYESKNLGLMFKNLDQKVYKDFACKPIIVSSSTTEDIHFVVGSSIGNKKPIKETIVTSGRMTSGKKVVQQKKMSEPLRSRNLYDNENFMWVTLSHEIIPTVPLGDFSSSTIYESLKSLATIMDYDFGIEDNVPYFRPKEDYFYHEYVFAPEGSFDYIEPLPTGEERNAYYYMSGEVIFVKNSHGSGSGDNTSRLEVVRKVNSSTVYPKELKLQKANATTYNANQTNERVSQIGLKPLYKIRMVIDEKNIIDISKMNKPYESNYTDIHLSYSDKTYRRKIKNSNQSTKKIFAKSIPLIDDENWIEFIARKLQKEISYDRTRLELKVKINPSLRGTDYIAVHFRNSEIKIGVIDNNDTVSNINVGKVYELYKIRSVTHNLDDFTSTIVADSVETSSIDLTVGGKIT